MHVRQEMTPYSLDGYRFLCWFLVSCGGHNCLVHSWGDLKLIDRENKIALLYKKNKKEIQTNSVSKYLG